MQLHTQGDGQMKKLISITTVAAALLLGGTARATRQTTGWYLMVPPQNPTPDRDMMQTVWSAPLSDWQIKQNYGSAKDCNRQRNEVENIVVNRSYDKEVAHLRSEGYDEAQTRNFVEQVKQQWVHSRCVASDDARLFQNTKQAGK
jgi:hypothetical protein